LLLAHRSAHRSSIFRAIASDFQRTFSATDNDSAAYRSFIFHAIGSDF
jgi:hypothetical protein